MQINEMMDICDFSAMYCQANEDCEKAAELKAAADAFQEVIEEQKKLLVRLYEAEQRVNAAKLTLGIPLVNTATPKKTNAEIYTEIIRANGKPMHVREIAVALREYGNILKGKNEPEIQVRNALNASKRFENVGGNTWWVLGDPLLVHEVTKRPRSQFPLVPRMDEAA